MGIPRSKLVDIGNVLVVGVAVGFAGGFFFAKRIHRVDGRSHVMEYVGDDRRVDLAEGGAFEITYPHPYTNPPELRVLTDEMNFAVKYEILDQRNDGFRINIERG